MSHTFPLRLTWSGATDTPTYSRQLLASTDGKADLQLSSAPGYAGDALRWNPEDLFGASLATCHTLTFLSLAQKMKLDVRCVDVAVTVVLDTVDKVTKITSVTLSPTIALAAGDAAAVATAWDKAHKYCFVANSITAQVELPPPVVTTA